MAADLSKRIVCERPDCLGSAAPVVVPDDAGPQPAYFPGEGPVTLPPGLHWLCRACAERAGFCGGCGTMTGGVMTGRLCAGCVRDELDDDRKDATDPEFDISEA